MLEKQQSLTLTHQGNANGRPMTQSINNNIIVDLYRNMTPILELNVKERRVRVQAGAVKDQLNSIFKTTLYVSLPQSYKPAIEQL